MSAERRPSLFAEYLRRLFAAGGAALVLALAVFAASPELHHWLHADAGPASDDECAVTLFASGVSIAPAAIPVPLPAMEWRVVSHREVEQSLSGRAALPASAGARAAPELS